nr:hypothetical protein [Planctomycetota bacterium]
AQGWIAPLDSGSWLAVFAGLGVFAFACRWPRRFAALAPLAGVALIAGALRLDPWPMNPLAGPLSVVALGAMAHRLGRADVLLPLALPAALVGTGIPADQRGWLAVFAAFALLAVGALWARQRARRVAAA